MNSFGLGLVLNFVDNASSGMGRATSAFQQMSSTADSVSSSVSSCATDVVSASYALSGVGDTLMGVGSSIIGLYTEVSQKVIDTGMEMMGYRGQLRALYGETSFEQKMQEIQDYAAKSVFEVQGLTQAIILMKSVGIEAMDEITTSSGTTTQTLMDYASDIAAMFPNMRNAYGTGVNAAMGALKEYVAEGNAMSLKRGAGLDITGLLGEDKGATMEERKQQVADLVEVLGIAGYTTSLLGTPTQQLSRMQDILFNTMAKISDSGVLDSYTSLLTKLADWFDKLTEDTEAYDAIVSVLSETLTAVLSPLESVLDFLIENSTAIVQWIKENPKLTKSILTTVAAIGALLVGGGALLKLVSSIGMASAGLQFLKGFPTIIGAIAKAFAGLIIKAIPLVALAAVLYTAWKSNLFGVRDLVTDFVGKFTSAVSVISDVWGDNSLSVENYEKAKEKGLLPLVETILDLKYRFDFFKQGFIQGWNDISNKVSSVVAGIEDKFDGSIFQPLIDKVKEFFNTLSNSDTTKWFKLGEALASIAFKGVAILAVISPLKKVFSVVSLVYKVVTGLGGLIVAHPIIAAIVAVIAVFALLYAKCEGFRNFINNLFSSIAEMLSGVFESLSDMLPTLLESLTPLKDAFMSFLPQLGGFLKDVIGFFGELINSVIKLAKGVLPSLMKVVTTIASAVMRVLPLVLEVLGTIFTVVSDLIMPIITELLDMVIPFISMLADMLSNLIDEVVSVIVDLLETIVPIIMDLIDLVVPMIKDIFNSLKPVIQTLMDIVTSIVGKLIPVIKSVFSIVADIIKAVVAIAAPIIKVIMQIVQVVVQILMPIIDVIITAIGFIIDIILGIVQVVMKVVSFIVSMISSAVQVIMSIVDTIVSAIMIAVGFIAGIVTTIVDTITGIIKGIINVVQIVWDTIVTIFSVAIDFFSDVFSGVYEAVAGVFRGIADFFTEIWNGIVDTFSTIGDTISGAIKGAINAVLKGAVGIVNGFIKAINFAIGVINAIPGVEIKKLNLLEVPQLAEGGVVDKPTIAEIGEDGQEAVVPLENNTDWIDKVAEKVAPKLAVQPQLQKTNNAPAKEEHNDYSVTFAAGSVVIQLANATEAELEKAADKLMKIIERKQQLKAMAVRN